MLSIATPLALLGHRRKLFGSSEAAFATAALAAKGGFQASLGGSQLGVDDSGVAVSALTVHHQNADPSGVGCIATVQLTMAKPDGSCRLDLAFASSNDGLGPRLKALSFHARTAILNPGAASKVLPCAGWPAESTEGPVVYEGQAPQGSIGLASLAQPLAGQAVATLLNQHVQVALDAPVAMIGAGKQFTLTLTSLAIQGTLESIGNPNASCGKPAFALPKWSLARIEGDQPSISTLAARETWPAHDRMRYGKRHGDWTDARDDDGGWNGESPAANGPFGCSTRLGRTCRAALGDAVGDNRRRTDRGPAAAHRSNGRGQACASRRCRRLAGLRRGQLATVTTRNGHRYTGRVVAVDSSALELRVDDGGVLVIPREQIVEVIVRSADPELARAEQPEKRVRHRDPNRTRYLYSPSAMTLQQGEAYISQKELLFTAVAFGVTDNVTVHAGAGLPAGLLANIEIPCIFGLKVGFEVEPTMYVGGGAETFVLPGFEAIGLIYANMTLGQPDGHFTLGVGTPFAISYDDGRLGDVIITLNGNLRISDSFALVTENWFMLGGGSRAFLLGSLALRVIGRTWAFDLGFIGLPTENLGLPIPWFDVTYNFQ